MYKQLEFCRHAKKYSCSISAQEKNIMKIKAIINTYMEVIGSDGFLYEYLCAPEKGLD